MNSRFIIIATLSLLLNCCRQQEDIVLVIYLDHPVNKIEVTTTPLRYNKKFAYSFTIDDGLVSAYLTALPLFKGGKVSGPYKDQWGFDQGGDGKEYPGLYFTDGCGNKIPFSGAVAINGKFAMNAADSNAGYLNWQQVRALYDAGWDILNHGYNHATGNNVDALTEITENNKVVFENTGIQMKQFVIPGGKDDVLSNEPYTQTAFQQQLPVVHCSYFGNYMPVVNENLLPDSLRLGRQFLHAAGIENAASAFLSVIPPALQSKQPFWLNCFTHATGNDDVWNISFRFADFASLFQTLESRWGSSGADNVWVASPQAVYEYLLVNRSIKYTVKQQANKIIIIIDPASIPRGLRHTAQTFLVNTPAVINVVQVENATLESSGRNMVNITF